VSIWTTIPAEVIPAPGIPVLSVGNLKGGVGKTTVVANLAIALVQAGMRVLAIDLDFQASLSVAIPPGVIPRREVANGGVHALLSESYDMFHDDRVTAAGVGPYAGLRLVRTSLELADVEDKLFAAFFLGERERDPRFALARKLADPRIERDFDIVLIDTPPRLTMASVNALCASTHVLIPTALTPMSQSGAVTFVEYLAEFRNYICPHLYILGVFATFTARGTLTEAELKALDRLDKYLSHVDVWREIFIPIRQDIANNRVQQNPNVKALFDHIARKIIGMLGLGRNGVHEDRLAHPGPPTYWADLPQQGRVSAGGSGQEGAAAVRWRR
jgi:cellulose biosynthesis protein BcsQ